MENYLVNDNVSRAERAVTFLYHISQCTLGLMRNTMAAFLRKHAGGDTFLKQYVLSPRIQA